MCPWWVDLGSSIAQRSVKWDISYKNNHQKSLRLTCRSHWVAVCWVLSLFPFLHLWGLECRLVSAQWWWREAQSSPRKLWPLGWMSPTWPFCQGSPTRIVPAVCYCSETKKCNRHDHKKSNFKTYYHTSASGIRTNLGLLCPISNKAEFIFQPH